MKETHDVMLNKVSVTPQETKLTTKKSNPKKERNTTPRLKKKKF